MYLVVEGRKKLKGKIEISGSKNGALPVLIASLLTDKECFIENVPDILDVKTTIELLQFLGKNVEFKDGNVLIKGGIKRAFAPYDIVKKMRASILVAGPVLGRKKKIKVSIPGGCLIGPRPINYHIEGFKKLGAKVEIRGGDIILSAKNLKGTKILLEYPSVGATENLLLISSSIEGETVIENPANEPEISILIEVLKMMGVKIEKGVSCLKIKGRKNLKGFKYKLPPDRIEAGTYFIISALAGENILIKNFPALHLDSLIEKMKEAGVDFSISEENLRVNGRKKLKSVDIEANPYPGFPTDLQPLWTVFMTKAAGKSIIIDNVFPTRFSYIDELRRMGAEVVLKSSGCEVKKSNLVGARVRVPDLRAGAALLSAALIAKGRTILEDFYHIERGYENFIEKLKGIGARIWIE
ncbi:MAG: UDP-N-acetylglucosamine 1-carboxyvinyltransferase [Caldiserica bacterium]|nr:MAG: UDP-N-acetylglucosamine 1-carboxyvinyltransferase [Caldisericota bacterium]